MLRDCGEAGENLTTHNAKSRLQNSHVSQELHDNACDFFADLSQCALQQLGSYDYFANARSLGSVFMGLN